MSWVSCQAMLHAQVKSLFTTLKMHSLELLHPFFGLLVILAPHLDISYETTLPNGTEQRHRDIYPNKIGSEHYCGYCRVSGKHDAIYNLSSVYTNPAE
ncbi:hypothetical protein MVEN_01302100 [Mycena venus]|uniref:Uncharacterized protein n=1 Tax=Mycena venus TaxID=2733690 RepID=A0A8H7CTU1_9AGAR|nr:hypothetical protein MVEN_01302100 [Mycena venus]